MEDGQPVNAAKIELTISPFGEGTRIEFVTLQPIPGIEIPEGFCFGIKAGDAKVGAQPELAQGIFQDAVHNSVRKPVFFKIISEAIRRGVVKIEPASTCTDP